MTERLATPEELDDLEDLKRYCEREEEMANAHLRENVVGNAMPKKRKAKPMKSNTEEAEPELTPEEKKRIANLKKEAKEIYESGNAYSYILSSCSKYHIGDQVVMEGMILSFAATYVTNCNGLHIYVRGTAGHGKSHCASTVYSHFPENKVLTGHFSDMSLFYDSDLKPGTVIVMDDQSMNDKSCELMKAQTSNWNKPYTHRTVYNGKKVKLSIPAHCPRWMILCDETGDEQSFDRVLLFHVNETPEQTAAIKNHIAYQAENPEFVMDKHTMDVSKYIWGNVKASCVSIPFASRIECDPGESIRTYDMIMTLTMASAILHAPVRQKNNGNIVASTADFDIAVNILDQISNGSAGSQKNKLSPVQSKIMAYLLSKPNGEYPFKDIMNKLTITDSEMSKAANGIKSRPNSVGLKKLHGISIVDFEPGSSSRKAIEWNRELYLRGSGGNSYFRLKPE